MAKRFFETKLHAQRVRSTLKAADGNSPSTRVDKEIEGLVVKTMLKQCPWVAITAEEKGEGKRRTHGQLSSNWDVIIDGLDGTKNFLAGIPLCVVGITVAYNGEFVYAAVGNPFDGPDGTLTFGELGSGAFLAPLTNLKGEERIHVSRRRDRSRFTAILDGLHNKATGSPAALFKDALRRLGVQDHREMGSTILGGTLVAHGGVELCVSHAIGGMWDYAPWSVIVPEAGGKTTSPRYIPKGNDPQVVLATNGISHQLFAKFVEQYYTSNYVGFRGAVAERRKK